MDTRRVCQRLNNTWRRPLWRGLTLQRSWPYALMLAGLLLLLYVGSQYGTMFWEQRRLTRQWEERNASGANPAATATVSDDGLIRVSIPKIDLDAIVVEGTSHKQLLVGPGRITTTALPGETGNAVITAHRDTFFRHIYELNKGDEIVVRRAGEVFRFEVTGKKIVDPSDVSVLRATKEPRLTLITCYPTYYIGPAPERLVVFSKLIDRAPDNARASTAGSGASH
jgi:sortase A